MGAPLIGAAGWQKYVDEVMVKSGYCSEASILGTDNGVWATSTGFPVSVEETRTLIRGLKKDSGLQGQRVKLVGKFYTILRTSERSLYGRIETPTDTGGGFICVRTRKVVLIALYEPPIRPEQCALLIENLADYLLEHDL